VFLDNWLKLSEINVTFLTNNFEPITSPFEEFFFKKYQILDRLDLV